MRQLRFTLFLTAIVLTNGLGAIPCSGQLRSNELQPLVEVLGSDAPYSFPEKMIVGRSGNIYVLDTELSNIFFLDMERGAVSPLCPPGLSDRASDMTIGRDGSAWILNAPESRVIKLSKSCAVQTAFSTLRPSLRLQVNTFGEIAVLTLKDDTLFDLYRADGQLLRSFGQRRRYDNPIADSELSDGHLLSDEAGGFYFSFNYPPLVQHYGRDGRLISEFSPITNIKIRPPNVSSQREGRHLTVSSRYQILVVDIALDARGRLFLLMSGEDKFQALTHGSRELLITTSRGKVLKHMMVGEAFHRLAIGRGALYLLRNREGLRLVRYAIP